MTVGVKGKMEGICVKRVYYYKTHCTALHCTTPVLFLDCRTFPGRILLLGGYDPSPEIEDGSTYVRTLECKRM